MTAYFGRSWQGSGRGRTLGFRALELKVELVFYRRARSVAVSSHSRDILIIICKCLFWENIRNRITSESPSYDIFFSEWSGMRKQSLEDKEHRMDAFLPPEHDCANNGSILEDQDE